MVSNKHQRYQIRVVIRAWAFRVGSGRARVLKNCRDSIGPDAGAKSRFLVSDRVFAIDGIMQKEHLVQLQILLFVTGVTVDG